MNNPLVITYCNKYKNTYFENTNRFIETLNFNNWDYIILGENDQWNGFITKITAVKNYLDKLILTEPNKVIVISDAHDVLCVRNSHTFIDEFKKYNKQIIVSMEVLAEGSIFYDKNKSYFQVTCLEEYFKYYNINYNIVKKKYVNGGLIAGYAKNVLDFYNWLFENNYTDDQKALGAYMNLYPELIFADTDDEVLHTTNSFIASGLHSNIQVKESPCLSEFVGQKSFFLHFPGINASNGQKLLYNVSYQILQSLNFKVLQNLYPEYNLLIFKKYYEDI